MSCDAIWEGLDLAAEHYHPRKLYFLERLQAQASSKLSDHFLSIREIYDPASDPLPVGAKVYDVTDALGNFLGEGRSVATPEEVGSTKKIAQPGDVVISRLRSYLREIAVIPDEKHPYLLSSEFIVLRKRKKQKGKFLLPYLLSEPVQTILQWSQDGSNHPRFAESLLLTLPLPDEILRHSNELNHLVEQAMSAFKHSKSLYAEAEAMLLAELGLDDLDLSHQPTYTRNFSETWAAGRLDAEYFQPKYQWAMEIMGQAGKTIGDVVRLTKRRFEPKPGEPFQYIEIGDVGQAGHAESKTVPGEEAPSRAQWVVKAGDVITSTVRPIRRLTALVGLEQDGYVCSSGFAVLKPVAIEPEVLLVYLRLPVVCEILDLHTSASMYPAISTTDLLNVPIPIPPDEVRARVVKLVRESRKSHREAKCLLAEAKRRVEEMVLSSP